MKVLCTLPHVPVLRMPVTAHDLVVKGLKIWSGHGLLAEPCPVLNAGGDGISSNGYLA